MISSTVHVSVGLAGLTSGFGVSTLVVCSLSLVFFLPGLGVACDAQALSPPDHQIVYLAVGFWCTPDFGIERPGWLKAPES